MAKSIAVEADVSVELAGAQSPAAGWDPGGTWSATPLEVATSPTLTIGGAAAAQAASTTLSYTGTTGGTATSTSPPAKLTLEGSSSALTADGTTLLRDGDAAQDGFGNKIVVRAAGPLRSD